MGRLGSKPRKAAILGEENSYDKQGLFIPVKETFLGEGKLGTKTLVCLQRRMTLAFRRGENRMSPHQRHMIASSSRENVERWRRRRLLIPHFPGVSIVSDQANQLDHQRSAILTSTVNPYIILYGLKSEVSCLLD